LTVFDGRLYFAATELATGRELWSSDGTGAGTVLAADIDGGTLNALPLRKRMANINGILYFAATTADGSSELWKSDGTAAGTVLVKDINPGAASSSPDN